MTIVVLILFLLGDTAITFVQLSPAPLFVQASIYSTTMMAVLNSRIKLGIVAESSTWLNNELTLPMSRNQEPPGIVFNIVPTVNISRDSGVSSVATEQSASGNIGEFQMKGMEFKS